MIADRLGAEADPGAAGEQAVLGVGGVGLCRGGGRLAVGRAADDLAEHRLLAPLVVVAEAEGEMVEQFRVGGFRAGRAEILEGFHEAEAEELFPEAVDHDPGGERVVLGNQPAGEGEPVGRGVIGKLSEEGGDAGAFDELVLFQPVAADEQVGGAFEVRGQLLDRRQVDRGPPGERAVDFRDAVGGRGDGGIGGEGGPALLGGEENPAALGDQRDGAAGVAGLVEGEPERAAGDRERLLEDEHAGAGAVDLRVGSPAVAIRLQAVVGIEKGLGFIADHAGDPDLLLGAIGGGRVKMDLREHGAPFGRVDGGFGIDRQQLDLKGGDGFHPLGWREAEIEDRVVGDVRGRAELRRAVGGDDLELHLFRSGLQLRRGLPERGRAEGPLLFVEVLAEGAAFLDPAGEIGAAGGILRDRGHGEMRVEVGIAGVVEEGHRGVVFLVLDRIVGMRVALHAAHGDALPGFPGRGDAVHDGGGAEFLVIGPAFGVGLRVAVEVRGDEVVERGVGQEVAGELLDRELVEGEVGVVGTDHPVAVRPGGARAVEAEALGIGVAGEVEPVGGPFLAVMGGGEEAVDFRLPGGLGVGLPGGFEAVEFGERGREADEVDGEPAQQEGGFGLGVGLELFPGEAVEDEVIDRVLRPVRGFDGGGRDGDGLFEGPVFLPFRALLDPLAEFGDFRLLEGRAVCGLGHHEVGIRRGDPAHQFRLLGFAGDDRGVSGLADGEGLLAEDEGDAAGFLDPAVAGGALGGEERADVAVEIDLRRHDGKAGRGDQAQQGSGRRHGAWEGRLQCSKMRISFRPPPWIG